MHDLVVLGAGPAGIGAAHRAADAGLDVVVLERLDAVGGAARSIDVAGVRCDLGSHRLHRAIDPAILSRLRGLLGDDLQERTRNGRIRLAGRWLPFPLRPGALVHLPPGFAAAAVRDTLLAPLRRGEPASFDEAVRLGLGPTMAERFYGPYARKLWGMDPGLISAEQARRRVGAATPVDVLRRVVRGADPGARTFLYPRRGFGQIFEALAEAAVGRGADLRLGATVTAVRTAPDGATVQAVGRDGTSAVVSARHVWSTLPLPVLARLHEPPPPPAVVAAASRLRTRAMVLVYLVAERDRWTGFDAHYLPEAWTPITRISEPTAYRDGHPGSHDPGDPPGRTVLCAEVPCDVDDPVWRADDAALADLVRATIARLGLPDPAPVHVETRRLASAYPITPVGFERDLAVVDDWAAGRPGLLTFGRQGLFVHDNAHHALAMAWAAGDAFDPVAGIDPGAWDEARVRFATHVVED